MWWAGLNKMLKPTVLKDSNYEQPKSKNGM